MTSELKSDTARANGAKSHGPKTAEGKEKSSRNSLNHGFTAKKTIVLACENPDQFQQTLSDYAATYQPRSPVEECLVNEMVACRWRMQRLRLMETALIDSEMERELPEGETPEDPGYRLAFAFRRLVDESRVISLTSRYESRLHRIHEHSHRTLRELQQTRKNSPSVSAGAPAPVQPEPPPPTGNVVDDAVPSSNPAAPATPLTPDDKKSPNEPTPTTTKDSQPLSIVRHRAIRRCSGQLRTSRVATAIQAFLPMFRRCLTQSLLFCPPRPIW